MLAPFVNLFIRLGISPDAVTLVGTLGVSFGAIFFFAQGWVWQGVLFITAFVFSDLIDGAMARKAGRTDDFGAFLDSTLDRVADGALFAGLAIWFFAGGDDVVIAVGAMVCLVLGMVVSYARAKAESLGFTANVGIAERAERLVSVLVVTGFTGLGLPHIVLQVTLALLATASLVTIIQRVATVRRQSLAESAASDEG